MNDCRNPASPSDLAARTRLNLGSGRRYDPTAVNLDVTPDTNPDVVHDLNRFPWPFDDDRFDEVTMRDVLEHLDDSVRVMEEIYRICRPDGVAHIIVPHFSSNGAFTDPTHKRFFALASFDYFAADHPNNFYTWARFRREQGRLVFRPGWVNKLVWRLANKFPEAYENRWAWVFPAWFISVNLRAEKRRETTRKGSP
jgi:SAM-dependent methyltransferase